MDVHMVAYLFALTAGVVSSGAIATLWAIAADEELSLHSLERTDLLTPFRAIALVFSAPTNLIVSSTYYLIDEPIAGFGMLLLGLALSFLQGIAILSKVFGVS